MKTQNLRELVGHEVVRTKGDYVVGRIGRVLQYDSIKQTVWVQWYGFTRTWVSVNSVALISIPFVIVKVDGKHPVYKKL